MKNFKSGNWVREGRYKAFQPALINRRWTVDDMEVQALPGQAGRHLGRLGMFSGYVPNIGLLR